ncbi:keratin, type I cytoskeletal 9-like [Harmonia axyridis]|uniref:keratin, type I cytoskeletal 9-like n=1 Tax=Harmonia axyridis TaxID=115357 RepID=UPI001E275E98|nr:keratin, type I cytoskeletal 9-like [Harmonia axyridis]
MIFICVFALLIHISSQELNKVEPATAKGQNNLSSVNFIYFYGPPPNAEQIRTVREVLKNEDGEIKIANPVVRYLVAPERKTEKLMEGESNQHTPPHNHIIGLLRKRRSASPTFKKGYKSSGGGGGGGGGCCNSCGQCGGGCSGGGCGGGGGHSGSYSQSTSYSSSSSGSYNSYGKKK